MSGFGSGLLGEMTVPCPACGTPMIRMSSGAICPECGGYVGGGGESEAGATHTYRSMPVSKGKKTGAAVYGEWPVKIAKGTRVGFEKDGVIWTGIVATYDVDEETGEVTMTIE